MSESLEALYRLATRNNGNRRSDEEVDKDFRIIEKALKDYEAIDNAKPSEALECLEQFLNEMTRCLENPKEYAKGYEKQIFWKYKNTFETTIKQALIQGEQDRKNLELVDKVRSGKTIIFVGKGLAMMNADKYHEYLKMEEEPVSKRILKAENELKAQEPKHYLKWEDLEFKEEELVGQMKVKLGDNIYYIEWLKNDYKVVNFYTNADDNILHYTSFVSEENKQFFNDLHLERVEE